MRSTHDIHNHNLFSQCCNDHKANVKAMFAEEERLGISVYGLSNHTWDETVKGGSGWYRHQSVAHSLEAKYAFETYKGPLKLLFGVETEYAAMSDILGMSYENAMKFDYLLVPHSHNHMKNFVMADYPDVTKARENFANELCKKFPEISQSHAQAIAATAPEKTLAPFMPEWRTDRAAYVIDQMLTSFESLMENKDFLRIAASKPVSVAHPFAPGAMPMDQRGSTTLRLVNEHSDELLKLFKKAASLNIPMEINCSAVTECGGYDFNDEHPSVRLFKLAKQAGCKFTFGTDSHSVAGLSLINVSDSFTNACGITESDVADWECLKY